MQKKTLLLAVVGAALVANPLFSLVRAGTGAWERLMASAAWSYDGYRVERLTPFKSGTIGPISLGDVSLIAEPSDMCGPSVPCDRYDATLLNGGMKTELENIPASALDPIRFAKNGNRMVYVNPLETNDHFAVVEQDFTTGEAKTLVADVFLNGATNVDVLVDGADIYLDAHLAYDSGKTSHQSAVYMWDPAATEAKIIGKHYELRAEELLDAQDDVALVKLTFADGYKELWFHDTRNVDYKGMTRVAIPKTWTEPNGDIVGAHFLPDGSIEYFQYFVRYTYNPKTDSVPVRHETEQLSWFRPLSDAIQLSGNRLAWVNAEDKLFVSENGVVTPLGTAVGGTFLLTDTKVFYATSSGSNAYTFATKTTTSYNIPVTDFTETAITGRDVNGVVWYQDFVTGAVVRLGYGADPVFSDARHIYWRGVDGNFYEATVTDATAAAGMRAVKVSGSPIVYLLDGTVRRTIPSEAVYFSYFDSWNKVETISASSLNAYALDGKAGFAVGTRVKFADTPKVYVVGADHKLHWIASQSVAFDIYGENWNKGIVNVTWSDMVDYGYGTNVLTERDISAI